MDAFTLLISLFLIMFAFQAGNDWLVFGIIVVLILYLRSLSATFVLLLALAGLFITRSAPNSLFPLVILGLIILTLLIGMKGESQQQPEYYSPELAGLMGGGGQGM